MSKIIEMALAKEETRVSLADIFLADPAAAARALMLCETKSAKVPRKIIAAETLWMEIMTSGVGIPGLYSAAEIETDSTTVLSAIVDWTCQKTGVNAARFKKVMGW